MFDILKDYKFKCVDFKELTKEDASYPHISALWQTMFKVDNFVHKHIGDTKPLQNTMNMQLDKNY